MKIELEYELRVKITARSLKWITSSWMNSLTVDVVVVVGDEMKYSKK